MVRIVLSALFLALFAGDAIAGQKCIKPDPPVYWSGELDVHENGEWHRGSKSGHISRAAVARFEAFQASGAREAKVVKCLEALIKNEKSKKAKSACKVPKAKRR